MMAPTADGDPRKVVLLSGASGQIGTAFCKRLSSAYRIVAVRNQRLLDVPSQLQMDVDPLDDSGEQVEGSEVFEVQADLREAQQRGRVVELALARFGVIDALVNLIGVRGGRGRMMDNALAEMQYLVHVNAVVPIELAIEVTRTYWRHHDLENATRNRVVVNVAAASGLNRSPRFAGAVFSASKAAQLRLSHYLSDELSPLNVRVLTLAPIRVTGMTSAERVVTAIESAIEGSETGTTLVLRNDGEAIV